MDSYPSVNLDPALERSGVLKAARRSDRNWFIALLIINTVGILEIAYIFFFSKRIQKIQD